MQELGKTQINNCIVEELDLDTGAGKVEFTGDVLEKADVDCGIGKTDINLKSKLDNYKIRTKTGIGSITVNTQQASDNAVYGSGNINIEIDGGIGAVNITTDGRN